MKHYTREQVSSIVPQQDPFLFVDGAQVDQTSVHADYTIQGTESFLKGHFKDEPIFPASILFEGMGQAACLWVLENAPALLGKRLGSNHVFFASMDGARVHRKTRPGDTLHMELKLVKLRDPLAIFTGTTTVNGQRAAGIERLVLAFGEEPAP